MVVPLVCRRIFLFLIKDKAAIEAPTLFSSVNVSELSGATAAVLETQGHIQEGKASQITKPLKLTFQPNPSSFWERWKHTSLSLHNQICLLHSGEYVHNWQNLSWQCETINVITGLGKLQDCLTKKNDKIIHWGTRKGDCKTHWTFLSFLYCLHAFLSASSVVVVVVEKSII